MQVLYEERDCGASLESACRLSQTLKELLNLVGKGLSAVHASWPDTHAFIKAIHRHQFMEYQCLCLRCAAEYEEPPTSAG